MTRFGMALAALAAIGVVIVAAALAPALARTPAPALAHAPAQDAPLRGRRADAPRVDLSAAPQPPVLPDSNAATALAADLAREVESIRARAPGDAESTLAIDASVTFRMMARELLVRGDADEALRHTIVLAGFRLADARGEFDASMGRAAAVPTDRVRASLERFRDTGLGSLRAAPTGTLLEVTRSIVAGLSPALDAAAVPARASHWPSLPRQRDSTSRAPPVVPAGKPAPSAPSEPSAPSGPASPSGPVDSAAAWSAQLRASVAGSAVDPPLAAAMNALADRLADAEAWPDLEPEVRSIAEALLPTAATAQSIAAATWLPKSLRDACAQRAVGAIERSADASSRAAALQELEQLAAMARAADAGSLLVRPRQQTSSRGPITPGRVSRTVEALAVPPTDATQHRRTLDRLSMVTDLLETMVDVRRLEEVDVRRDLRTLRRQLSRDALKSEDPVLRQVETLAAPDASPADPACSSLLEGQRRRIRALESLDGVDRALAEIEAQSLVQGASLATRLRTLLTQLGDQARAGSALITLERFLTQWQMLREPPAEAAIRANEIEAVERCAGRAHELLGEIDRRRSAWAAGWSSGEPDDAWRSANELLALLALIDDSAALARTSAQPRLIGRWGGWDDLGGIPGSTHAMDSRLALAIEALARQDEKALADALTLLASESPLWRLRARLLRRLGTVLEPLPDGLAGALGRATSAPTSRSFMASRSNDLAALGRFSRELLFAQAARDEEQCDEIELFLREMATDLLRSVPSDETRDAGAAGG